MSHGPSETDLQILRSRLSAVEQLLEVYEKTAVEQTDKLYQEIIERKRIASELAFRNVILSTQQETSLDGILVVDENGIIISHNQRFVGLWGLDPGTIETKHHLQALQPVLHNVVDPEGFVSRLTFLYEHREEKAREEIVFKDGRVFDRYTSPMFGPDGDYQGRVWYLRDITERVSADKALREREDILRNITDTAQDAVVMMNDEGDILFWNGAAERIFGYTTQDAVGAKLHLLIIPLRFRDAHLKGLHDFKTRGQGPLIGKTVEVTALKKDGTEFPLELSLAAVKVKDKWCATGIARDIGERKLADLEMKMIHSELKMLYEVSQATSRTIELKKLLSEVLQVLAGTGIFPFEIKGAIFLLEGERLRLASFVNLTEETLAPCEPCLEIRHGNSLCDLARERGEVIVSGNSLKDERHAQCRRGNHPHGHVIVPLKAMDAVIGVLSIYTRPDTEISDRVLNLLSSIGNQIGIAINNSRLYEETKGFSLHDPLTGLANRRFLQIQMEKSFETARRYREDLSVIMLDIDYFKRYNDTHGHLEGDRLLVQLAEVILREMRRADYVFRYGGEEFLIILPETGSVPACEAAERLRKVVEQETGVTISLGLATLTPTMQKKEELIEKADKSLYLAKQGGRNRVESVPSQNGSDSVPIQEHKSRLNRGSNSYDESGNDNPI